MPSPDNALQTAIFTRLTGYAPLTTALGGQKIFDFVPPQQGAPYVRIGEDTLTGADTKSGNRWEATLTIHVWYFEKAGSKSVKALLGHIYDALHRQEGTLTVSGFSLVLLTCEFQQTIQETAIDGENDHYYHGIARYRALLTA